MSQLSQLRPSSKPRVMDLLVSLGIDVRDWAKFKGGAGNAAANPKYCYEYSYDNKDFVVLNLWFSALKVTNGKISVTFNLDKYKALGTSGPQRRRRIKFVRSVIRAAANGLPIHVIIGDHKKQGDPVERRLLDPVPWAVVSYDPISGDCVLQRGAEPVDLSDPDEQANIFGFEGEKRSWFKSHRKREARLRRAKIAEVLALNNGLLSCEVPNCGFSFVDRYGEIGRGFAHVHHKTPLSKAPDKGRNVLLSELAVVCPNCHAMIHIGGECRSIETLIPSERVYTELHAAGASRRIEARISS